MKSVKKLLGSFGKTSFLKYDNNRKKWYYPTIESGNDDEEISSSNSQPSNKRRHLIAVTSIFDRFIPS